MIEQIYNIGNIIRKIEGEKELVELWTKDTKSMDNVIIININEEKNKVSKELISFYEDVYKDSLIYQQGNGHVGAGIKIENYKETDANKIKDKKVLSSLEFMEIDKNYLDEVWENIAEEVNKDIKQSYFIMISKNGENPRDLFSKKYEDKIKDTYLISDKSLRKKIKSSTCHMCKSNGKNFDTAVFKCFTNDKEVYSNTDGYTFSVCEDCLISILNGRSYINENLKTIWMGSEVMFLPHEFNEDIKDMYEGTIDKENKITKLIDNIREAEEMVLDEISNSNSSTDIIFFSDPKSSSEWKITYSIRDVMPSRFSKVGNLIGKYKNTDHYFSIAKIMKYLCYSDGKFDSKNKDRMRLLDIIFKGSSYNRTMFFNKVMTKYKSEYYASLASSKSNNKRFILKDIHEVYNFMCECGCLSNSWKMVNEEGELMEYKDRDEFFEVNKAFFNTNIKKAWFIIGQIYSRTIWESKRYKSTDGQNISSESSHLEKNFFFSKKFDYVTFVQFANTCSEKLMKYGSYYKNIKEDLNEAKSYMISKDSKLNSDEAKYIFFWGMDTHFKGDEINKNQVEKVDYKKENEVEGVEQCQIQIQESFC